MTIKTKIAHNTLIQIAGKIISTALGLISLSMMTRYLGQAGFGEYTTIVTFVSFFAILADFGLTLITVQMISRPNINELKIINNLFGLRLVSIIVFIALAPIVAIFLPYPLFIKVGILISAVSFIFPAINQVIVGLFQKKLRMDKAVISETISRIILISGLFLSIQNNWGLNGVLWTSVASSLISFISHYLLATKYVLLKPAFDKFVWLEIINKSWPLAITIILNLLYLKTDIIILSFLKNSQDVGLYGASYRIIDVLTTLPFMFAGIILPLLTAAWFENNVIHFKKVLQKSFDLMIIFSLPIIVGTLFLAEPLVVLVAGADFKESAVILKILIFALAGIFWGCMFSHAIIAINQQKKMISSYVFVSISSIILYLLLIPRFSYFGAASVTIYSEISIALLSAYVVWKYTKFIPSFRVFYKSLAASIVMSLGLYIINKSFYLNWTGLIIGSLFSSVLYFLTLYFNQGISKSDVLSIINKK